MATDAWTGANSLFKHLSEHRDLRQLPEVPDARGTLRRLRDALADESSGWRDIASLTRQILLEAQARENTTGFTVPLLPRLPTREQWEEIRCQTGLRNGGSHLYVTALPWHPPVSGDASRRAAQEDLRQIHLGADSPHHRKLESYPADPFFTAALGGHHSHYVSTGQRQAARAVALAEPGSTTIICLPTGHGKTAVAMAPALLSSTGSGVSVVVVPTSVLAADLERRTFEIVEQQGNHSPTGRYAYTSGLPIEDQQKMREDIATGRQRLVFTSPESLVGKLKKPLEDAAEAGLLQYFVIDEAHLVEQWGNSFRTEFQTMASHRRIWISKAPQGRQPITVAMSATLTAQQVETLDLLFASPQRARVVWASQLRHEPSYYIDACRSEGAREAAILEAVSYLPKPMIVYTTKVEHAQEWASRLHAHGLHRVAHVTGDSTEPERRQALEGWSGKTGEGSKSATQYDIVVGTSAFGLGVDLADVKTIVHACLPETVDRYYQEVGRAGRDGSPSIAYLATTRGDEEIADYMSDEVVIGAPRAWQRWEAMFHDRTMVGDHHRVSLDSFPPDMNEGFHRNRQWNIRVLNLMVRAGLVAVHPPQRPTKMVDESEVDWRARLEQYYTTANDYAEIELLDSQARSKEHFYARFEDERQKLLHGRASALRELKAALRGNQCIGDVLGAYYRIPHSGGYRRTGITCRGCPHCRAKSEPTPSGFYRLAGEPRPLLPATENHRRLPLVEYFGDRHCLSLWWQDAGDHVLAARLVESLVRRGAAVVGGPGMDGRLMGQLQTTARTRTVIVDGDGALLESWRGPVIWMMDPNTASMGPEVATRFAWDVPTYLIHPRTMHHPDRRGTPLVDVHPANLSLRRALEEL
ncbi:protein DpdF [Streptomyces sp. NPDC048392]|uniref:protein DpdF n=1 Tax=Streptomyces sp. NPDC048392 TaxID=3365543 RepID=UPI003720ABAE